MSRRVPTAATACRRSRREEGQTVVIVAVFMVVLLAVLGLVIDVGELYLTQRHLQTAADSAALAAAQDLPNSSSNACTYSASPAGATTCTVDGTNVLLAPSGNNYNSRYGNVQTTAAVECLSVSSAGTTCQTGTACNDPAGYGPAGDGDNLGCNAIKVTEQTTVKPFFMQILGFGGQNVTATSTAGIAGGTPHPLDVEMIDDTTASMRTDDTCGGTPPGGLPRDRRVKPGPHAGGLRKGRYQGVPHPALPVSALAWRTATSRTRRTPPRSTR